MYDNDGITDPGLTVGEQGHDEIHYVKLSSSVLLAIDNNLRAIMDTGCSIGLKHFTHRCLLMI